MATETNESASHLQGISNIMLGVADLAASLAFYRDRLGLTVRFESPGFAFLDGGSVTLALSEPLRAASDQSGGAVEIVFSVADVTAAHERLKTAGIEFANEPRQVTPTDWAANFIDPDGHVLSIFGPNSESESE